MRNFVRFFTLGLFLKSLWAVEPYVEERPAPWLTGPLLEPLGEVVPRGHYSINAYLFAGANTGRYDSNWHFFSNPTFYTINPQLFAVLGLTPWMDVQITPQLQYNISQGKSAAHFGDLLIGFDFQLIKKCRYSWVPSIKFSVVETLPTGKYEKLDFTRVDRGGFGTFATDLDLLFYQLWEINKRHFLTTFLSLAYTINTTVHVEGFNAYGGGDDTKGKVYPGNYFTGTFSFEYSFNQRWSFAMDSQYIYTRKTGFSGNVGVVTDDGFSKIAVPASHQISFASAIEYNFSPYFGIIAGVWFTAFGKNSLAFIEGAINIDYGY
ncbi:MAG: hypothetical protein JSR76_03365 [Verrucomicrobia bacterium]|nr:hypothetical protein [Verrucomicrobiota bacterium]